MHRLSSTLAPIIIHEFLACVGLILASSPGQFFINRTDEKIRPGIDCRFYVCMRGIFVQIGLKDIQSRIQIFCMGKW